MCFQHLKSKLHSLDSLLGPICQDQIGPTPVEEIYDRLYFPAGKSCDGLPTFLCILRPLAQSTTTETKNTKLKWNFIINPKNI